MFETVARPLAGTQKLKLPSRQRDLMDPGLRVSRQKYSLVKCDL